MLELYHHGSSVCAAKVRFALAEKNLEWNGHYVDILAGEQFQPDFLRINPRAMVPALVHDDHIIIESTVICEYAEDVFPDRPIFPKDPVLRAQARVWTKAVDEELHPACSAITYVVSHRHTILREVQTIRGFPEIAVFRERRGAQGEVAMDRAWARGARRAGENPAL